jgi:hypothetical protein
LVLMLMSTMPPKTKPKISQSPIDEALNNHFKNLKNQRCLVMGQ